MGWTALSERELQRIQVLSEVMSRARTVASASVVLALSARQVHRLLKVYRSGGAGSLAHKGRGRPSNNRIQEDVRHRAMALVRTHYPDFGPTLAAEMLAQRHELKVSRETLRGWMTEAGLWLSRKQRRSFHQPRLRREARGELVDIGEQQTDICLLDGGKATDDAKMLDTLAYFAASTYTGSIHNLQFSSLVADNRTIYISGSACTVGDYGLLFFSEGVKKCAFADIWTTEQCHAQTVAVFGDVSLW